jgi:hypothetical protein
MTMFEAVVSKTTENTYAKTYVQQSNTENNTLF